MLLDFSILLKIFCFVWDGSPSSYYSFMFHGFATILYYLRWFISSGLKFTLTNNTIGLLQLSNQNPWSLSTANLQRQTGWQPETIDHEQRCTPYLHCERYFNLSVIVIYKAKFLLITPCKIELGMRNINLNITERPKRTASRKVRHVSFFKSVKRSSPALLLNCHQNRPKNELMIKCMSPNTVKIYLWDLKVTLSHAARLPSTKGGIPGWTGASYLQRKVFLGL